MREAFLVGRILVGGYYLWSALNHFTNVDTMSQYAAAKGVPAPGLAIVLSGLLLLIAGLTLLLGIYPRVGVIALVLFLLPVSFLMHQFWDARGAERISELVNFSKNMALLGSSLMFIGIPEPWPYSLGSRLRLPRRVPA